MTLPQGQSEKADGLPKVFMGYEINRIRILKSLFIGETMDRDQIACVESVINKSKTFEEATYLVHQNIAQSIISKEAGEKLLAFMKIQMQLYDYDYSLYERLDACEVSCRNNPGNESDEKIIELYQSALSKHMQSFLRIQANMAARRIAERENRKSSSSKKSEI